MKKLLTTLFGFILFYHVVAYVTPAYAAGAQAKPKPIPNIITVNIVVKNQSSVVLNQFHYTPATTSTLPKKPYLVDNLYANQWASFPIQMLPGVASFQYGYDQNNYCRLQLQVSPNGSVLVMSAKNYGVAQCATPSVSGKTVAATINMIKPTIAPSAHASTALAPIGEQAKPKLTPNNIITVNIVVTNQGNVVLNQFHYTPATTSTLPKKPYLVDSLSQNQRASFPIQMLPGVASFQYGYDQNNYCRLQLQVSPNGSVLVMSAKNYGVAQCATPSVSGKTVAITINLPKPITVMITNNSIALLTFSKYQLVTSSVFTAPAFTPVQNTSPASFTFTMLPGKSHLIYGYDQDHSCEFIFNVGSNDALLAQAIRGTSVACDIKVTGNNSVAINMLMRKVPAAEGAYCYQEQTYGGAVTYTTGGQNQIQTITAAGMVYQRVQ